MVAAMRCGADGHVFVCVFTQQMPHHSISAVGCSSCASPNDLINALFVNGCIAF